MKERPILFSAPMVRAILDGRKTMTRRVVNPPINRITYQCPYGQPGDWLWVRESFSIGALIEGRCAGNSFVRFRDGGQKYQDGAFYSSDNYAAGEFKPERFKWKPSIHMPRWASRLTLEITCARVERLQDITEADAIAEGLTRDGDGWRGAPELPWFASPIAAFRSLWESIHGAGSWDDNPWVWVVEFRRLTQLERAA